MYENNSFFSEHLEYCYVLILYILIKCFTISSILVDFPEAIL